LQKGKSQDHVLNLTTETHPRKLMQLIIMILSRSIGYMVIIRLDRMIHWIIQGGISDSTGLPGQAGQ